MAADGVAQDDDGTRSGVAQGSVHRFDLETAEGVVLSDDGRLVPFSAEAFARGGLRLLRVGQRVTLDVDASGTVQTVRIQGV